MDVRPRAQPLQIVLDSQVVLGEGRGKMMPALPIAGRDEIQITGFLGPHTAAMGAAGSAIGVGGRPRGCSCYTAYRWSGASWMWPS